MKKLLCTFLIVFSVMCCGFAADVITVKINDVTIAFDVAPQTVNGRTMVPVRAIFEALDATVSWDEATSGITAVKGDTKIVMHLNDTKMTVNDKTIVLDAAPFETGGRTLVPVRAISEAFDCKVLWEDATQTVYIQTNVYTAADIAEMASPAVFYIETYNENDELLSNGSGFFISSDGKAVTTYDVVDGAASAYIEMTDSTILELDTILYANKDDNVVIFTLKGDKTEFPYLKLGDSDNVKVGKRTYALSSPEGFDNTLSEGIISNTNRKLFDSEFIQFTAPISYGSGGGAIINEACEAIGIISRLVPSGENINIAIPVNIIKNISYFEKPITLDLLPKSYVDIKTSEDYIELNQYKTAKVLVTIDTNIEDCDAKCEIINEDIIDVEVGEALNDNTMYIEITGKKPGTAAVAFNTSTGYADNYITVDVYSPGMEIYKKVNLATYTQITGEKCKKSLNSVSAKSVSGYNADYDLFQYEYNHDKLNLYFGYLETLGFEKNNTYFKDGFLLYDYSNFFYTIYFIIDSNDNIMTIELHIN